MTAAENLATWREAERAIRESPFAWVDEKRNQTNHSRFEKVAREAMPALLAFVGEVLALHAAVDIYAWADDCADPERHEHGEDASGEGLCLSEPTGESSCSECRGECDEPVMWPCPTVRLAQQRLGGGDRG